MISVGVKIIDNYSTIQKERFVKNPETNYDHHDESFYKRYMNSHKVARHKDTNEL